jgi:hypothetical protein
MTFRNPKEMELLSEELLVLISTFLDRSSLYRLEIVSSIWKSCLAHNFIWLDLANQVWKDTGYIVNVPYIEPMLKRIERSCTIKSMKKRLSRYLPLNGVLEKTDLMIALRTRLLFDKLLYLTSTIPTWCNKINDGKATYVYANNIESKRKNNLLVSEIIMFEWILYYKGNELSMNTS